MTSIFGSFMASIAASINSAKFNLPVKFNGLQYGKSRGNRDASCDCVCVEKLGSFIWKRLAASAIMVPIPATFVTTARNRFAAPTSDAPSPRERLGAEEASDVEEIAPDVAANHAGLGITRPPRQSPRSAGAGRRRRRWRRGRRSATRRPSRRRRCDWL